MKEYSKDSIQIVDFKARPDRAVYILKNNSFEDMKKWRYSDLPLGYVIINNDSWMENDGKILALPQEIKSVPQRDIFIGRTVSLDWENALGRSEIEVVGIKYDLKPVNGKLKEKPSSVAATICMNKEGYTSTEGFSEKLPVIDATMLKNLEHFLVPKKAADEIRKYHEEMTVDPDACLNAMMNHAQRDNMDYDWFFIPDSDLVRKFSVMYREDAVKTALEKMKEKLNRK